MLKKNETIELEIEDISIEGAGIGRYDGQIVFVQKALPKERVISKIIKTKKNYAIGRLEEVLEHSEYRIEPFCKVFGKCGGCTLQHLSYNEQLKFKANHIKQCMKRLGKIDITAPEILACDNKKEYRNKASFPVSEVTGKIEAGFYAPHSHRVVPSYCAIQQPDINRVKDVIVKWANENGISAYNEITNKGSLRHIIVRQSSTGDIMAGLVSTKPIADDNLITALYKIPEMKSIVQNINTEKTNSILGEINTTIYGTDYITEQYDDLKFRVSLKSFLQVNHSQTEKLYRTALNFADIKDTDVVFDLFCGIGTISLLAAKQAKSVLGIEYLQEAVDNAVENSKLNNVTNANFIAGDAAKKLDEGVNILGKPDVVIIDPPRKGCDALLINNLCRLEPKKVVYVSCDPATLARDVAVFNEQGYLLSEVKSVDMFAHTTHTECIVKLCRI